MKYLDVLREEARPRGQAVPGNSIVLFTPNLSPIFLGITEKLSHLMEPLGSLSVDLRPSKRLASRRVPRTWRDLVVDDLDS